MMEENSVSYQQVKQDNTLILPSFRENSSIQRPYWRRNITTIAGLLVIAGILIFLQISAPKNGRLQTALFKTDTSTESESGIGSEATIPSIALYNRYSLRDGLPGQDYKYLTDYYIVEPYKETFFRIVAANPKYTYETKITKVGGDETEFFFDQPSAAFQVTDLSDRRLEISTYETVDGERVLLETSSYDIMVRYVRREIRALFDDDLNLLMDTMKLLWSVPQEEGEELYGSRFKNIIEMHKFHLKYAADATCDHLHDGYGFITQHIALTNVFEQSLQAVNPAVNLPYWDYTFDIERHYAEKGLDFTDFTNSEMFQSKYFGATDKDTGYIADGRWEGLEVPYIWDAGLTKEEMEEMPSNAYGQMRSPWSNNADPHVVRSAKQCGADASIAYTMPYCSILSTLMDEETFDDYLSFVSYTPHGPIHIATGGSLGCDEAYDSLLPYFDGDKKKLDYIKGMSFVYHEGMYRYGRLTCTTKSKECICPLLDHYMTLTGDEFCSFPAGPLYDIGFDECYDVSDEYKRDLVRVICTSGLVEGDNSQASSAYTPEFWPIHPTVERVLHKKRLVKDFPKGSDGSWYTTASWLPRQVFCHGHFATDVVLRGTSPIITAKGEETYPTNVELFDMIAPFESNQMPYIYDNLKWDYCAAVGYEI
mmetsp:Transcript_7009/g.8699  ORF Transcript_7009/g.8699 Transcript_7009/m.8699 type:complete len:651 (+) Transcript_7009:27-1979(+)